LIKTTVSDLTSFAIAPSRAPIYDLLESERIAVYPIDALGLTTDSGRGIVHVQMEQDAHATGGLAFYNNNRLSTIASHIVVTDGDYYTLAYSPQNLPRDGKWHHVKVKLENVQYQLSYRRGYFDDGQNNLSAPGKTRTILRADGHTLQIPSDHSAPIIFRAQILPASALPVSSTPQTGLKRLSPKKGQTVYSIRYIIPAATIQPQAIDQNIATDNLRSVVIAFSHLGTAVASLPQSITVKVDQRKVQSDPDAFLTFDQQVSLPAGQDYLHLSVWDATTGRFGTVNLSLNVTKTPQPQP
jgi:hypothetical protein